MLPSRFFSSFCFCLCAPFFVSCASNPPPPPPDPEWIHQATRTVDNGYIVYIGNSEDAVLEKARFKAEAQALEDLANECTFTPKGTRVEDHYDRPHGARFHESYVKVAVDFESCEKAKKAVTPEAIQVLANASMTDEIARYQDEIETPSTPETVAQNPVALAQAPGPIDSSANTTHLSYVVIQDEPTYFFARQEIASAKQTVILAPPGSYPPNSVASQSFTNSLAKSTEQVTSYEVTHPMIRTTHRSFSQVSRQAAFNPATFGRALHTQNPNFKNPIQKTKKKRRFRAEP